MTSRAEQYRRLARDFHSMARSLPPGEGRSALLKMAEEYNQLAEVSTRNEPTKNAKRQMTSEDIAYLRLLADWHDRQSRYLLLTVPVGQHDQGHFHSTAAARLSRLADEATMNRTKGGLLVDE